MLEQVKFACFFDTPACALSSLSCLSVLWTAPALPSFHGVAKHPYLLSKSWIPVTRRCAYVTISLNKYAKLARLSSALRVRFRFRS